MFRLMVASAVSFILSTVYAAMPETIDILYIKAPFNLQNIVMKKQNLLEKEFAGDNVKINWIPMTQGGKQGQALASNSAQVTPVLNFSSFPSLAPVFADETRPALGSSAKKFTVFVA